MIALARKHPCQLVLGALILEEELATSGRQLTLGHIAHEAIQWATDSRDLMREIATDSEYGIDRCHAARADGVVTLDELREVESVLEEIREEAVTGRIF